MAAADVLILVAVVVALAVAAEMVGDRIGLPNFVFFILAGLLVGPPGLGFVHHDVFGEGLGIMVGLAVALILFHSGSGITVSEIRKAHGSVFRMAVGGVVVTFVAMSVVAYLLMNVPIGVAMLIGALLVATGTTVIEPLLESVPVHKDLAAALDIEATISEVSAGVLSVTVFHAVTVGEPESSEFVFMFAWVLAVGVAVGLVGGAIVWALFRVPEHAARRAPKHARQLFLATAIVTYAVAEYVTAEAGVAAAATAGVVLGNADLPYEEHIADFKEDITTFIIAFLFVVLASFVDPEWLATVGLAGLAVSLVLLLVVRPAAVFLTTAGSPLSVREKLFLSTASPRGIIPAGVATLLAIEIQDAVPETAAYLTGTVLVVILVSSSFEGLLAGRIARRFDLTVDETIVVGGGRLGMSLADQYADRGERVVLIESEEETAEHDRTAGFAVHHSDGTDEQALREAGIDRATRIVAATHDDAVNREVARLATETFGIESVLVRLNRRDNHDMFADLDVELLTGSQLELWSLDHLVDQSSPDWLEALTRSGGLGVFTATENVEASVAELDRSLPNRAFVVSITRDGETWIPDETDSVADGDRLTLLGRSEAIEAAIEYLSPPGEDDETFQSLVERDDSPVDDE